MKIGVIIFIVALLLSIFLGILGALNINTSFLLFIMLILGILSGHYNITKDEKRDFLIASIAFILSLQIVLQVTQVIAQINTQLFAFIVSSLFSLMVFAAGAIAYIAILSVVDLIRD